MISGTAQVRKGEKKDMLIGSIEADETIRLMLQYWWLMQALVDLNQDSRPMDKQRSTRFWHVVWVFNK